MKKSSYSKTKIIIFKVAESAIPVAELCCKYGISDATFHNWRAEYGVMYASMMKRIKERDEAYRRLIAGYGHTTMNSPPMHIGGITPKRI